MTPKAINFKCFPKPEPTCDSTLIKDLERSLAVQYETFDRQKLVKFRKAYEKFKKEHAAAFTFSGKVYTTDYAKYLIEYLDDRLPRSR